MLGYVTLGTNDFDRSKAFYDKALAGLGGKLAMKTGRGQLYGNGSGPLLGITAPFDGSKPAGHGNGTMVALAAPSRAVVDQVYRDALAAGATDEGAPGIRTGTFYGAYFRDPDGNKLCVFTTGA
jgi:catechol 2,3-dioxygenase-like lactoylglutathione lyase family enzyme